MQNLQTEDALSIYTAIIFSLILNADVNLNHMITLFSTVKSDAYNPEKVQLAPFMCLYVVICV